MKTVPRVAWASLCAALVLVLAGCRSPILEERSVSDEGAAKAPSPAVAEILRPMTAAG